MIGDVPVLPAIEALRFFRAKGYRIGFAWQDVWQEEHAKAFTVAKAMSRDLLEEIRAEVDKALAEGLTLEQFRTSLRPKLEARGWWGRKQMIDPLTAERKTVQLGSPRRLKTIFDVNMRTAYQAGRWERVQRNKGAFPLLRYVSVKDGRERPEHGAWHGTILPVDHPWWQTHYPPCGWNCRCTVQAVNARMVARNGWEVTEEPIAFPKEPYLNKRTGEVTEIERGIDPGWNYNVGAAYLDGQAPRPLPAGLEGEATAAIARPERVKILAFLKPFGVAIDGERVFEDEGGWPLAISAGWFRDAAGEIRVPDEWTAAQLGRVADTIRKPDAIVWRWVRAANGRAVPMRRWLSAAKRGRPACRVEAGRIGWRFAIGAAAD